MNISSCCRPVGRAEATIWRNGSNRGRCSSASGALRARVVVQNVSPGISLEQTFFHDAAKVRLILCMNVRRREMLLCMRVTAFGNAAPQSQLGFDRRIRAGRCGARRNLPLRDHARCDLPLVRGNRIASGRNSGISLLPFLRLVRFHDPSAGRITCNTAHPHSVPGYQIPSSFCFARYHRSHPALFAR